MPGRQFKAFSGLVYELDKEGFWTGESGQTLEANR
jgi:hypothetical protein